MLTPLEVFFCAILALAFVDVRTHIDDKMNMWIQIVEPAPPHDISEEQQVEDDGFDWCDNVRCWSLQS